MCGIGGVMFKDGEEPNARVTYYYMKHLENRGKDGFGITNGDDTLKGVGAFTEFIPHEYLGGDEDDIERLRSIAGSEMTLYHTRLATVGSKVRHNMHPFESDHFILAHNGTISNYKKVEDKYDGHVDYDEDIETDTYRLVNILEKYYMKEDDAEDEIARTKNAIKKMGEECSGQITTWIYHKEADLVFLTRRNNPLVYCEFRNAMIFGSNLPDKPGTTIENDSIGVISPYGYQKIGELPRRQYNYNRTNTKWSSYGRRGKKAIPTSVKEVTPGETPSGKRFVFP